MTAEAPPPVYERAPSVLIVDDEPFLAELAQRFLEQHHFSTDAAHSADEALEKMDAFPYDAIVSDYQMPVTDGIGLLRQVREKDPSLPFILFTGRGREEVVIEALNEGADFYLQKGGDPKAQFTELSHKLRRAIERRSTARAIEERNEVLGAILAASPFGIALVKKRTIQWLNDSLASMLGYETGDLLGMPVRTLYDTDEDYIRTGNQIMADLRASGQSRVRARLLRRNGSLMESEIQMALLNTKNPLYSRMVTITDISRRLAITREIEHLSRMPHLELNPVLEVNERGLITYFNEAAIDVLVRHGRGEGLEVFLPPDISDILALVPKAGTQSITRTIRIGTTSMVAHITLSRQFRIARISVFDTGEARCVDSFTGANPE